MNTLNNVTKTENISIAELNARWSNTQGMESIGNQYSNMDTYDIIYVLTQEQYDHILELPDYARYRLSDLKFNKQVQTNLAYKFDAGWVSHAARAEGSKKQTLDVAPLNLKTDETYVLLRHNFQYGSSSFTGMQIVARVNGNNITVFKSK